MKDNKIIWYAAIGVILLFLILVSLNVIKFGSSNSGSGGNVVNGNMPEECQKPEGQSLEAWKEHLGHHQNTLYCLNYYK